MFNLLNVQRTKIKACIGVIVWKIIVFINTSYSSLVNLKSFEMKKKTIGSLLIKLTIAKENILNNAN